MSQHIQKQAHPLSIGEDQPEVKKARDAISAARLAVWMDNRTAFWGAIAMRLTLVHNPIVCFGTCATDGRMLVYSAEFINSQTHKQLCGLLVHEAGHIVFEHTLRREGRDPYDWNIACDHVLNNEIKAERLFELPDDGFCDPQYRGWSAEEVYPHVARERKEKEQNGAGEGGSAGQGSAGNGQPSGGEGPRMPAGGVLDSPDPVVDRAEIQVAIQEAAMCAKASGNLPGAVQKLVNKLTRPALNFHELLAEFVQRATDVDYSMSQPSRRYLSAGGYLPSLRPQDAVMEGAFFMDTSWSRYSDEQLAQTVGALDLCLAQVQPERVHVMAIDTCIQWRHVFERGDKLQVETPGGGGTRFNPGFDALEAEGIEPAWCIYITDGCGRFPEHAPPYPVLWIITERNITAPWGVTVHIDERGRAVS